MRNFCFFSILMIVQLFPNALFAEQTDDEQMAAEDPLQVVGNETSVNSFDANLDSLISVFKDNYIGYSNCKQDSIGIIYTDDIYMKRLQQIPAIMELTYNDIVKSFIELYTVKKRKQVSYMLGVAKYYFPIFEQELDAANLPIELKYLPVIESALNPKAYSRAGAAGLWQFMYATGKSYGLEGNSLIDDRRDPLKATHAAVQYLKDLHGIYNDWALVIAAYNCGPGNVNKAITRSGGKRDYWAIYPYLPLETRGYVPAFIAATYTMTYYKEHNICPAEIEMPLANDTVMVKDRIHFIQISEKLNIPIDVIESLNPQYRRNIIPGNGKEYTLCLPQKYINAFLQNQDSIIAYKSDSLNTNRISVVPAQRDPYYGKIRKANINNRKAKANSRGSRTHTVRKGDTMYSIARKNGISVDKLKKMNGIKNNKLKIGQTLRVK